MKKYLDTEWLDLIKKAKEIGLTIAEVQTFIHENSKKKKIY